MEIKNTLIKKSLPQTKFWLAGGWILKIRLDLELQDFPDSRQIMNRMKIGGLEWQMRRKSGNYKVRCRIKRTQQHCAPPLILALNATVRTPRQKNKHAIALQRKYGYMTQRGVT